MFTRVGAGIYGFNWWFNATGRLHPASRTWPDAPAGTIMSLGHGGDCSVLMPGLRRVLVSAGGDWGELRAGDAGSTMNRRLELLTESVRLDAPDP